MAYGRVNVGGGNDGGMNLELLDISNFTGKTYTIFDGSESGWKKILITQQEFYNKKASPYYLSGNTYFYNSATYNELSLIINGNKYRIGNWSWSSTKIYITPVIFTIERKGSKTEIFYNILAENYLGDICHYFKNKIEVESLSNLSIVLQSESELNGVNTFEKITYK